MSPNPPPLSMICKRADILRTLIGYRRMYTTTGMVQGLTVALIATTWTVGNAVLPLAVRIGITVVFGAAAIASYALANRVMRQVAADNLRI